VVLFWGLATSLSALDFLTEGEKQLSLNNPTKALTYLEAALAQGTPDERLLLDLGLAYQRAGQPVDAQKAFRQGASLAGPAARTFLLNLGVSFYSVKDWIGADAAFTQALDLDPTFSEALLNRANSRLNAQAWAGAVADYRSYQVLSPENSQKEKIDRLIALLDQAVIDTEAVKLAEETRKKKEETARQAVAEAEAADRQKAEAAALAQKQADEAAAEAERKNQEEILAKIRESLAGASEDSKSLSSGLSGVKTDNGDFSLEP